MKKLISLVILIPLGVILVVLSVANRKPVTFSLDPFSDTAPAIAMTLPFFVFLFVALLIGMLLGGMATWWTQGKHRKIARKKQAEAQELHTECEMLKQQLDTGPEKTATGLPLLKVDNAA